MHGGLYYDMSNCIIVYICVLNIYCKQIMNLVMLIVRLGISPVVVFEIRTNIHRSGGNNRVIHRGFSFYNLYYT